MFKKVTHVFNEYKILRGMLSYAVLWPVGSLMEQTLVEKRNWQTYDWKKCLRCDLNVHYILFFFLHISHPIFTFSLYGTLIMGPTMYVWVRTANVIWPRSGFRYSLSKAITEQFTVDPTLICTFLFVMSILEQKTIDEAKDEVRNKFIDTYKVGAIYWPTVQTINFTFVPLKNQVVCTSFFSMIWSAFLAYEKHLKTKLKQQKNE
ncbi:protein sym1 isoform X1 [Contarinia nasturtii]|uniref:protein sym1 isoform X1 n=1 Tax=Contarinia nasturtii TaxID=265458 RepID=UPI0012D378D4|nr:protein sym1 isoform X1 [Contarinia nasturtii]XP_031619864.1 protein sym1 isoform X1 [Contarinia nasturtii]